jgi:hypothetical protein
MSSWGDEAIYHSTIQGENTMLSKIKQKSDPLLVDDYLLARWYLNRRSICSQGSILKETSTC